MDAVGSVPPGDRPDLPDAAGDSGRAGGGVIRVILVEDHAMVAEGLSAALNAEPDIEVVGWLSSIEELAHSPLVAASAAHFDAPQFGAAEFGAQEPGAQEAGAPGSDAAETGVPGSGAPGSGVAHPDVALVDYHLPDGNGADVAVLLRARSPHTRVVIVSASRTEAELLKAVEAGCVGFVDKRSRVEDLARVVRAASRGEASFDAGLLRSLVLGLGKEDASTPGSDLSEREREVLRLLAAGLSTEAMAAQLYLSTHTVRNHIRNLTAKLGAHSRLEAVAIAARVGLVTLVGPASS